MRWQSCLIITGSEHSVELEEQRRWTS